MQSLYGMFTEEKKSSRKYAAMSRNARKPSNKGAYAEMSRDEAKHARMLKRMISRRIKVRGHKRG